MVGLQVDKHTSMITCPLLLKNKQLGEMSTQKKIAHTENFVGELMSRKITYFFADPPLIRINF